MFGDAAVALSCVMGFPQFWQCEGEGEGEIQKAPPMPCASQESMQDEQWGDASLDQGQELLLKYPNSFSLSSL